MFIFNQFSEISPPGHSNCRNSTLNCVVNMLIQQYITGYMLNSPEHCQNNSHIDDGIINYLTAQKGRWTNNRYNSHLWLSCLERQAVTNFTLQSIYKLSDLMSGIIQRSGLPICHSCLPKHL